jgi:N-acetyl-anhydromuramyl-L-alanine amidase AmpD
MRAEIENEYADLDAVGKRGLGPDDLWSITLHHTGTTNALSVLGIAEYHTQTRGYPHIAYHFIVAKGGRVYFCKKLAHYSAQCGNSRVNKYGIAIAVHGDFTQESVTDAQLKALEALIESLEEFVGGGYGKSYPLPIIRHKDLVSTACPGNLYEDFRRRQMSDQ